MERQKGSALSQYAIIIALVAIALVPIFFIFGKTIAEQFLKMSNTLGSVQYDTSNKIITPKVPATLPSNLKGGSLGGTPENPVKQCTGNTCNIDFGEFVLHGIPADFSEAISSGGISGGTDDLANIIMQIALQLDQEGKTDQALEVRKLAVMGHNLASTEKTFESLMISCNRDSACVKQQLTNTFAEPENYDNSFNTFPTGMKFTDTGALIALGNMRSEQVNNPHIYESLLAAKAPAAVFLQQYQALKESNLSDTRKNVIDELYYRIARLSDDVEAGFDFIYSGKYSNAYGDPYTGEWLPNDELPSDAFDIYANYKPSSYTHIDSALICAAGNNKDTGTKCH